MSGTTTPKKVLITGGAGFIGSHLVHSLRPHVEQIVVLDNLLPQVHTKHRFTPEIARSAQCVFGDVRDPNVWHDLSVEHADIDVIVHLAALTGTGQSMQQLREYDSVNSGGTATLLESVLGSSSSTSFPAITRVILASSRAIYGEGAYRVAGSPDGTLVYPPPRSAEKLASADWEMRDAIGALLAPAPTPEDAPAQPGSFYGATKLVQEEYVRTMLAVAGIPYTILRFQNVFGPGQSLKNPYTGVIGVFYSNIVAGRKVEIYEDGLISRDFVYVSDVAEAIMRSILGDVSGTFNIGSGDFTRMSDIARMIGEALGIGVEVTMPGIFRVGDIRHNAADIAMAESSLGYRPTISVEDGLRRYVEWAHGQTPLSATDVEAAAISMRPG